MKTSTLLVRLFLVSCIGAATLLADGVMRPVSASYPKDFLRTRMTKIDVTINGQIAVTKVYQEFVHEGTAKTNAVYSFPLPAQARATDFFFWSNDTMYQAVLKVKEQAVNPGTGEGGIDALLNAYLGTNAIRVLINDVPPGIVQKTQLEYISLCSYENGRVKYTFPLNTQDFAVTPLEAFSLTVRINAGTPILGTSVDEYTEERTTMTDARHAVMSLERSKMYETKDLTVSYTTSSDSLVVDCYSVDSDSLDGHFLMFLTPPTTYDTAASLRKNIIFLLDRSSSTSGVALDAGKSAIQECLKHLRPTDRFNIIAMNTSAAAWKPQSALATPAAIAEASAYVGGITATGGSSLAAGFASAFGMITSDSLSNAIMMFSDGYAAIDPKTIAAQNKYQAGIFPIGIGTNTNRARLEMIAYMNYGFPTFLAITDPVYDEIIRVFTKINDPLLKNTKMEFGSNVYDILPQTLQTVYNGSRFYAAGRYRNPGTTAMSIAGFGSTGARAYDYLLPLTADKTVNKFAKQFWGKEKIDAIERQIAVYGATDSLKQLAIKYSLAYNIRCQYTAYLADKTNPVLSDVETGSAIESFTLGWSGTTVVLTWTLRAGSDVVACNVYRSSDPATGFVRIGAAAAADTRYTDNSTSPAPAYYRIEIVTRSGRRFMSQTVSTVGGMTPSAFSLETNYPNPFNPSTTLRFSVAASQMVKLTVYDMLGRQVALLANERLQPGVYDRTWNAQGVPSGVYVAVFRAGTFTASQKLILQK